MNPDALDGEEPDAWYRRSPDDIAQARQAAAQQQYNDFFGGEAPTDSRPDEITPTQVHSTATTSDVPAQSASPAASSGFDPRYIDARNAGDDADAYLFLTGNPHNPRLKREWQQR